MLRFLPILSLCITAAHAQTNMLSPSVTDSTATASKILLVPFQPMMYFSDADQDISRFSKMGEPQIRNQLRDQLDLNVYHQLLSAFDVVDLWRSNSLDGEKDLNRIYACTRYTIYSSKQKKELTQEKGRYESSREKLYLEKYSRKSKDQAFWICDSAVMLGMLTERDIFPYLFRKYNHQYILYITQFEIGTSNKNTIEWLKQDYNREYTIHYNLFDKTGELLRAETLTIKAGPENNVNQIAELYLRAIGARLKEILIVAGK
jgi:hypothetical protein